MRETHGVVHERPYIKWDVALPETGARHLFVVRLRCGGAMGASGSHANNAEGVSKFRISH